MKIEPRQFGLSVEIDMPIKDEMKFDVMRRQVNRLHQEQRLWWEHEMHIVFNDIVNANCEVCTRLAAAEKKPWARFLRLLARIRKVFT